MGPAAAAAAAPGRAGQRGAMAEAAPAPVRAARARTDARTRGPGDGLRVPGPAARPGVSVRDRNAATLVGGGGRAPLGGRGAAGLGAGRRPGEAAGRQGLARTRAGSWASGAARLAPRGDGAASVGVAAARFPQSSPPPSLTRPERGADAALPISQSGDTEAQTLGGDPPSRPQGHVASHPRRGGRVPRNARLPGCGPGRGSGGRDGGLPRG